jgi:hypothetical protein
VSDVRQLPDDGVGALVNWGPVEPFAEMPDWGLVVFRTEDGRLKIEGIVVPPDDLIDATPAARPKRG